MKHTRCLGSTLAGILVAGSIIAATGAHAQNFWFTNSPDLTTLAKMDGSGSVTYFPFDPAFSFLGGVKFGPDGNLYAAGSGTVRTDPSGNWYGGIIKINPKGYAAFLEGNNFSTQGIDFDGAGNLFALEAGGVAEYSPSGTLSTFVSTLLNIPYAGDVTFDGAGNLFVGCYDGAIRKIDTGGTISVFVPPATFVNAQGLAFDALGNLIVVDEGTRTISKVDPAGTVTLFSSDPALHAPKGLVLDGAGNLYVCNQNGFSITEIDATGSPVTSFLTSALNRPSRPTFIDQVTAGFDPPALIFPELVKDDFVTIWMTPQIGAQLVAFGAPARNGISVEFNGDGLGLGQMAFVSSLGGPNVTSANNRAIWAGNPYQESLIVRKGDFAPDATGTLTAATFLNFSDPVQNSANGPGYGAGTPRDIAFRGVLKLGVGGVTTANDTGLWSTAGVPAPLPNLHLVAREGAPAPDTGGATFASFTSFALPDVGDVVFIGGLKIGTGTPSVTVANNTGIWAYDTSPSLRLVARKGDVIAGKTISALSFLPSVAYSPGQSRSFSAADGSLVYRAGFTDGSSAIFRVDKSSITTPLLEAATNAFVPTTPTGAKFVAFGFPARNNSGNIAFVSTLMTGFGGVTAANNRAIYAGISGAEPLIVQRDDPAAGVAGATFGTFSDPVYNNADEIAFRSVLKLGVGGVISANDTGLWSTAGGTLHLVAREGDLAPDTGGATFTSFTSFALPDAHDVVFIGGLKIGTGSPLVTGANNTGIWAYDPSGNLRLIVRKGDSFPIHTTSRTISGLHFLESVPYSPGQSRGFSAADGGLVCKVNFTDGSYATLRMDRPFK